MIQPATQPNGKPAPFSAAKAVNAAVVMLPAGRTIEAAPGQMTGRVLVAPPDSVPALGVSRWQPAGDGTYKPVVQIHALHVSASVAAQAFGIEERTIKRLIFAGFVTGRKPSPNRWQVNILSLSDHLRAVEDDPDFWTDARIKQFAEAL